MKGDRDAQRRSHAEELLAFATSDAARVISQVVSRESGLTQEEIAIRLIANRKNRLDNKQRYRAFIEFMLYFRSPLVLILLVAAGIAAYLGQITDAVIIGIIILVSVCLDFYQEHKANKAAEALKARITSTATVIREGVHVECNMDDVVVGDMLFLSAGDIIPADCRILEANDFFVNQSSLTGESVPAEKHQAALQVKNASLSDLTNIVFFGTNVISGSARAVVIRTGKQTELGTIAADLITHQHTEFDRGIRDFGYLIVKFTLFLVLFIFLFNAFFKHDWLESFLFAVAIAVGLTPDLLPMIMTVTMARGSVAMAKQGVIVKRLSAIPNFGSMDVLCTDKTGTLTEDRISLVKYVDVFGGHNEQVLLYTYLNSFHQTGIRNPLDKAVLSFKTLQVDAYTKIDEIPFDFRRRRLSVVVQDGSRRYLITKGAPEEILSVCTSCQVQGVAVPMAEGEEKWKITSQYRKLSEEGYRVLALAIKQVPEQHKYEAADERGLTLLGFVAFLDPPKKDVKEVLEELSRSGVTIKIITGDNELVTKRICSEIGLSVSGFMLGSEVEIYSDEALAAKAEGITVFARCSPEDKKRIIRAIQAKGHVVGYLGDGINDAPALTTADVGISVDSAVDVAKESADIILTHKSLAELKEGVFEGRKTFGNTMKYMLMGVSSNLGNMFSVAGAAVFLPFLPMLPTQILLNNLVYETSLITIPSDNVDASFITRPRKWSIDFIKRFMLVFGPLSSCFDFITFGVLLLVFKSPEAIFQTGWFLESLATQILVVHIIRTKEFPFIESKPSKYLIFSTVGLLLVGWIIPYTPIGKFFGFVAIPWYIALVLLGITALYLITVQIVKVGFYRWYDNQVNA